MDQKILDALKKINEKLGGTNDPGEKWGTLLEEIAENLSGSELPEVTSDDKDKFLHTNDTTGALEWADASGGGGSGAFIVTLTGDDDTPVVDKTNAEIYAAVQAGSLVICRRFINVTGHYDYYYLMDADSTRAIFSNNKYFNSQESGFGITVTVETNDNVQTVTEDYTAWTVEDDA